MESEKDAVIRRARDYSKRHHGLINPDAEIMKEEKVKTNKKGVPVFNALNNEMKKHGSKHSSRTKSLLRNELLYRWLNFLERNSKSSKGFADLRSGFMDELFKELGI